MSATCADAGKLHSGDSQDLGKSAEAAERRLQERPQLLRGVVLHRSLSPPWMWILLMRITTFEDVADSEDEFYLNRDKILLDEGPEAKRARKWREKGSFSKSTIRSEC